MHPRTLPVAIGAWVLVTQGSAWAQSAADANVADPASAVPERSAPAGSEAEDAATPAGAPGNSRLRDYDARAPSTSPVFLRAPAVPVQANDSMRIARPGFHEQRRPASNLRSKLTAEFGFLDPLAHRIQFGKGGTEFDYVRNGGQDVLFPFMRFSVEGTWKRRHSLVLLYQPLDIRTAETLRDDLQVDNVRFPAGTAVNLRYGFDFYRISYLYNLISCREQDELSIGVSLQVRNAIIDFTSADGQLRRSNRDVGPVPALKSRGRWHVSERAWLGYEADGMYAPVKYINGGKSDVVGAILDLSLRGGYNVAGPLDLFVNVRYLGGGAKGTSKSDAERGPGDGYTSNWLHFLTTSVGAEVMLERLFAQDR